MRKQSEAAGPQVVALVVVALVAVAALVVAVRAAQFQPATSSKLTAATSPVIVNAVSAGPNTVTVVGSGQVEATPDQAVIALGVQATRPTVAGSLASANYDMNRLLASLHGQGVADTDIQTAYFSVGPAYCNGCSGFTASNSVNVTVHHLGNVGSVIGAAVSAVGADLNLNGTTPTLSDESSQLRSARVLAIADAHTRAQQWASQTGRQLGAILSISEVTNGQASQGCQGGCGGGASGGVPIAAGQTAVDVNVTVVYQLR